MRVCKFREKHRNNQQCGLLWRECEGAEREIEEVSQRGGPQNQTLEDIWKWADEGQGWELPKPGEEQMQTLLGVGKEQRVLEQRWERVAETLATIWVGLSRELP